MNFYVSMSFRERQKIRRQPLPQLVNKDAKRLAVSLVGLQPIRELQRKFQPSAVIEKSKLKGADAKYGFIIKDIWRGNLCGLFSLYCMFQIKTISKFLT